MLCFIYYIRVFEKYQYTFNPENWALYSYKKG